MWVSRRLQHCRCVGTKLCYRAATGPKLAHRDRQCENWDLRNRILSVETKAVVAEEAGR